jgi:autotransporter-associated beta strand protein
LINAIRNAGQPANTQQKPILIIMKPRNSPRRVPYLAAISLAISAPALEAQITRTWRGDGNQAFPTAIWGGVANWVANTPADGANNTALFAVTFNNGYAVTNNVSRNLGHITFTDPDTANVNHLIIRRSTGDNTLNLTVTTGQPAITVSDEGHTLIFEPRLLGTLGFAKEGPGRLVLSNPNSTYTGPLAVNGGILEIGGGVFTTSKGTDPRAASPATAEFDVGTAGRVGNGNYAEAITIAENAAFIYNSDSDTNLLGDISGEGSLAKGRSGILVLAGTNTYTGGTTVTGGALIANTAAALPGYNSPADVVFNGGTIGIVPGEGGWTNAEIDDLLANATKTAGALGIDTRIGDMAQWAAFTTTSLGPALGITKLGNNTLTLNEANNYTGPTIVRQGSLTLAPTGTLGNGGSLLLEGGSINLAGKAVAVGEVIITAAAATGGTLVNGSVTGASYAIANPAGRALVSANLLANGNIGLVKTGAGTAVLAGANTYTGDTQVQQGILMTAPGGSSASDIVVSEGASFGVDLSGGPGQWTSTGDLTTPAGGTIRFVLGSTPPSTTTAPIQVADLTLAADQTIAIFADDLTTLQSGASYPLITWTGSGPADANAITTLFAHRVAGSFSVVGNTLFLNVVSVTPGAITWNVGDGDWNTTTPNWLDAASAPTTYFDPLDDVVFGDAAGVDVDDPVVTLNSVISPASITVDSEDHDYTINGTGSLSGPTSITVDQPSERVFKLGMTNTHTGGITVNGGTLIPLTNQSLGPNGASFTVNSGGMINFFGTQAVSRDYHAFIQGNGVDGRGAIFNELTARQSGLGSLTLLGDATIGCTARWDLRPLSTGIVNLNGHNLTKVGDGQIALIQCNYLSDGTITVQEGILGLTRNTIAGDLPVVVNNGSTLFFENNSSGSFSKPVIVNGSTVRVGGSAVSNPRSVTVTGSCTFLMEAAFNLNGGLGGDGSINKTGGQALTINAPSTHTGTITVSAGSLVLGATGALPTTTGVTINAGATFNTSAQESHALPAGQTITFGINPAGDGTAGRIVANGLDVSNANANFVPTGELDDDVYIIATYNTLTGDAFANATLPPGYIINYAYEGNRIALIAAGDDYAVWASQFPGANLSDPDADFDGDGVSNNDERIFGLDPTSPTSTSPIVAPFDSAEGTLGFTRRDPAVTGYSFVIETSTNLMAWHPDTGAILTPGPTVNQMQTVTARLSSELLDQPRLFVRVAAKIPPPLLAADFEENNGGFTVATAGGTAWQHGAPNSRDQGGGAIIGGNNGSTNAWGINLTGGYGPSTNTSLRSPMIDLTGISAATLRFARAIDAASGHTLEVTVINVEDDTVIATVLPPAQDADTLTANWQMVGPVAIPPEALGRQVRLQWRFVGDGDNLYNGAYIDDVTVTGQP